jgi:Caspase domain
VIVAGDAKYHVLLVGIDKYTVRPLHGCVNDIDAVQRLLIGKAGIPHTSITRLASPHEGAPHETAVPGRAATLANIRQALARLASPEIQPKDRVFIYYSGHGGRTPISGSQGTFHYESLVPVDFNEDTDSPRLLLDFELNGLLTAITQRTRMVSLILDCCHSAGATRDLPGRPQRTARSLDLEKELGRKEPLRLSPDDMKGVNAAARGFGGSVDDCQVLAACLNHELAQEDVNPSGMLHGLLTDGLVSSLEQMDESDLRGVQWARIWQRMRDRVETANPFQHPWMSGSLGRAVLSGPPVAGDVGFGVKKTGANEYAIEAGTLAEVGEGAELAVYGDKPAFFSELNSAKDVGDRASRSLLKVIRADRASAMARAEPTSFELMTGARARLVKPGAESRLRCAVVPANETTTAALRASPLLEVVDQQYALARLERDRNGTWLLTDDLHGVGEYPPLLRLSTEDLDRGMPLLELYFRYSLPLRMAARCGHLPGALQVSLLQSPKREPKDDAGTTDLPEAPRHKALDYSLAIGNPFCVQIRNTASSDLRVTLVNCAASGKVEFLGDQIITAGGYNRFWENNDVGKPFVASEVRGNRRYIDRMVAIGTTRLDRSLQFLRNDTRFADVLVRPRSSLKEVTSAVSGAPPAEQWTATQVSLGIGM